MQALEWMWALEWMNWVQELEEWVQGNDGVGVGIGNDGVMRVGIGVDAGSGVDVDNGVDVE